MAFVPYGNRMLVSTSVAAVTLLSRFVCADQLRAWAVVIALEKSEGKDWRFSDYAGLGRKYPALAAGDDHLHVFVDRIPPTLGFVGKFYLFRAAISGHIICWQSSAC